MAGVDHEQTVPADVVPLAFLWYNPLRRWEDTEDESRETLSDPAHRLKVPRRTIEKTQKGRTNIIKLKSKKKLKKTSEKEKTK